MTVERNVPSFDRINIANLFSTESYSKLNDITIINNISQGQFSKIPT